jgi:quercetin dioxygenase-like cupin family protein
MPVSEEEGSRMTTDNDGETGTGRRKTTFFSSTPTAEEILEGRRYRDILATTHPTPARFQDLDPELPLNRTETRLLVDQGPMHLTEVNMPAGSDVPRHRHGRDQIVLVVEGSLWQGNRELTAGSGFFTPAGSTYSFRAGPEGAKFHEFFFGDVKEWAPELLE